MLAKAVEESSKGHEEGALTAKDHAVDALERLHANPWQSEGSQDAATELELFDTSDNKSTDEFGGAFDDKVVQEILGLF